MTFAPSLLSSSTEDRHAFQAVGAAAGLGSAFAVVPVIFVIRSLASSEPEAVMSVWFHMTAGIVSLVLMLLGLPTSVVFPSLHEWLILGGLVAASLLGQIFLARGFNLLSLRKAAVINLLQLVHAMVLGTVFLNDPVQATSIGGSVLVAAGVVVAHMGRDESRRAWERLTGPELGLELAQLAGADNAPLLSPDISTDSDDSPIATTPVCIPVAELNAAQCRCEGDLSRAFVPFKDVGHTPS